MTVFVEVSGTRPFNLPVCGVWEQVIRSYST